MQPRRDMQEVKAPEMFQFSDDNPWLGGVLLGVSRVEVRGKEATQYMVDDRGEGGRDPRRYTFLGTYDLDRKLGPEHIGHWLDIRYEGEDHAVQTQGSPLRKFRVQISKEKEPGF